MNKKKKIIGAAVAAIIVLAYLFTCTGKKKNTEINFETDQVTTGTIRNSVTATGTIEAVTEVEVGTQVSGIISKLYVDYNSIVKKGQIIAELDKTNLISRLKNAQSNMASAKSEYEYQKANYQRYKTLYDKGLVSRNDYESAELSFLKAKESYMSTKESVEQARTDLGYATITSPIDGVVLSKKVEEGQTVAASMNTPTLFVIAKDLKDMRVIAKVDEADIGEVKENQRVSFTVDAYPNDVFEGVVTQVRQEATTESNVVTYEVVISAPNNDQKLKPGLTANVSIYTLELNDVVSVKSKALKFTPSTEVLGKNYKIVDCKGKNKLWTIKGNTLTAHKVEIGVSDGVRTEIKNGIAKGEKVVTSITEITDEEEEQQEEEANPFMPRPGKNNKKK